MGIQNAEGNALVGSPQRERSYPHGLQVILKQNRPLPGTDRDQSAAVAGGSVL